MSFFYRAQNAAWERYLGIDTRGVVEVGKPDAVQYSTMAYSAIFRVLGNMRPEASTRLVDIGCGKARTVCCASRMGFGKVVGIEYTEHLAAIARQNLATLKVPASKAEILRAAAEDCSYADYNAFYLYNPFGAATLRPVVARILADASPGKLLRVAYVYPVHLNVLTDNGFTITETWKAPRFGLDQDAVFLEKRMPG
jgi:predicted RNA methylase